MKLVRRTVIQIFFVLASLSMAVTSLAVTVNPGQTVTSTSGAVAIEWQRVSYDEDLGGNPPWRYTLLIEEIKNSENRWVRC